MADEPFDDRYVGFREHAAAQQRTDAELARLRERAATTEAALLHEIAAVRGDIADVKQLITRPPPPAVDHNALVMQRALDALSTSKTASTSPFLLAFALLGAVALGVVGVMVFT